MFVVVLPVRNSLQRAPVSTPASPKKVTFRVAVGKFFCWRCHCRMPLSRMFLKFGCWMISLYRLFNKWCPIHHQHCQTKHMINGSMFGLTEFIFDNKQETHQGVVFKSLKFRLQNHKSTNQWVMPRLLRRLLICSLWSICIL